MRVLEGKLVASGLKVGIVAARFNEFIVSKLVFTPILCSHFISFLRIMGLSM